MASRVVAQGAESQLTARCESDNWYSCLSGTGSSPCACETLAEFRAGLLFVPSFVPTSPPLPPRGASHPVHTSWSYSQASASIVWIPQQTDIAARPSYARHWRYRYSTLLSVQNNCSQLVAVRPTQVPACPHEEAGSAIISMADNRLAGSVAEHASQVQRAAPRAAVRPHRPAQAYPCFSCSKRVSSA